MSCRICGMSVEALIDLGNMPPANWLVDEPSTDQETFPLTLEYCAQCASLQLQHCLAADVLYSHYYYVTPASPSLENHYRWLIDFLFERGYADGSTDVLEIGSNRGAFLNALRPRVRSTIGVDPAENVVSIARENGIDTICDFFNGDSARRILQGRDRVGLIVARHCMAHNEWPQQMLEGVEALLAQDGILAIENNYAGQMVADAEFDQIYHEHMFYYSLTSLCALLKRSGFRAIDVALTEVHGGSIVCIAAREGSRWHKHDAIVELLAAELETLSFEALRRFADRTYVIRDELRAIVSKLQNSGNTIAAYGATAKGATLLNFCGFTARNIAACADSTPIKQGRYIPGAGVPIVAESLLLNEPPDYFLLTAWNYKNELIAKARAAGAKDVGFIVPIPEVLIVR